MLFLLSFSFVLDLSIISLGFFNIFLQHSNLSHVRVSAAASAAVFGFVNTLITTFRTHQVGDTTETLHFEICEFS